ncbi:hypothetical protein QBC37DRAFT_448113 [Rhypophila decipiens]|uniref:Uncharacterized protein n=1 Tax=Rhypophila decipiens TaxID=261697 RepID=A0AAN6Y372_9PEZI|nr:hypothetical protein QBC37DRAFT_448113 [Rhypophila decipiens]
MLQGPYIEARPEEGDWVVILPGDNPEGAKVVLNVIHHRPANPNIKDSGLKKLHAILTFAQKYDLPYIMRAFSLLPSLIFASVPDVGQYSLTIKVGLAWETGGMYLLGKLVKWIVHFCHEDEGLGLTTPDGTHIEAADAESMALVPVGLFDAIAMERRRIVDKIFENIRKDVAELRQYGKMDIKSSPYCRAKTFRGEPHPPCTTHWLDSIMASFTDDEIRCISARSDDDSNIYPFSINHLESLIGRIRSPATFNAKHSGCDPFRKKFLCYCREALEDVTTPMAEEHKRYLSSQG